MVLALLLWLVGVAHADPATTRDALDRLQEVLQMRIDEGRLAKAEVVPAILVSAAPRYEASADGFMVSAIEVLERAFGSGALRLCEACMVPRTWVEEGVLAYQAGPVGLDEVARLDSNTRGTAQAAKTAIWLDEHRGGVSIRIVDLSSGRVVFAQNVDPTLNELRNTERTYSLAAEYERRAKRNSLTQGFVDFALYPRQHISLDWTDQWGKTNANLSGITLSIIDPVAGLGVNHHRRIPVLNMLVGGKLLLSLPTAVVNNVTGGDAEDLIDPLLTAVGMVRVPFGRSNYGLVASVSTNGAVGVGISLMNISLLPVIP
ncbi:MAG: hypothetical protein ACI8PZ_002254 [Myxococcota bacterium]